MDIFLTDTLEKYVIKKVHSGMYNNASEVICEALRLLYRQDNLKELESPEQPEPKKHLKSSDTSLTEKIKNKSESKNWNAVFAASMSKRNHERSQTFTKAKVLAKKTEKEPFKPEKFKEIYTRLNSGFVDKYTPWETLLKEAEYDYYVSQPDKMNLEEFVKYMIWLEGWG